MSSTLFARGINTQMGGRRKAEEIERRTEHVIQDVDMIKQQIATISGQEALIAALSKRCDGLQDAVVAIDKKLSALIDSQTT